MTDSDAIAAVKWLQLYGLTRQLRSAHQLQINRTGALAAFADGPDDEGLAAAHVAGGEDLVHAGFVAEVVREDVAAEGLGPMPSSVTMPSCTGREAHGEEDEVAINGVFGASDWLRALGCPFDFTMRALV